MGNMMMTDNQKPPNDQGGKFVKLYGDVRRRHDLTATAKILYSVLVDFIGGNGKCWPGMRTLARECGTTRPATLRAIQQLEQRGLVQVERGKNGQRNRYRLVKSGNETLPVDENKSGNETLPRGNETLPEAVTKRYQIQTDLINQTIKAPLSKKIMAESFEAFWREYPPRKGRKENKARAVEQWKKLHVDDGLFARIMAAVKVMAASDAWPPDAYRWLRDRRWEDETAATPAGTTTENTRCSCGAQGVLQAEDGWRCMACIGAAGRKAGQN